VLARPLVIFISGGSSGPSLVTISYHILQDNLLSPVEQFGLALGLECSPLPELAWASASDGPKEENNQRQKPAMVVEGWEYCKLTWDLLNYPRTKHKARFCANLSWLFMDLFREQCYEVWNVVEEACPSLCKRKQTWW
jgi:hypothetical protein